jgi:hypothetical protein
MQGQNTVNTCIARLLLRYLAKVKKEQQDYYNPHEFWEEFKTCMTTPPNREDTSQMHFHGDVYIVRCVCETFLYRSHG